LRKYSMFSDHSGDPYSVYFDEKLNWEIFSKVARKCYMPTNNMLLDLIHRYDGKFKFAFSITGIFLEQCARYDPRLLESFIRLTETGCVEILGETYYHSLCSLFRDKSEFYEQVEMHKKLTSSLFKSNSKVFRNTEALFSNEISKLVDGMGYKGIITEGTAKLLVDRSPNHVYYASGTGSLKVLMRNYGLSDDVAYRFSDRRWSGYPLTPGKYAHFIQRSHGDAVNLFMDYETFGEHQWADTGIFDFLKQFPGEVLKYPELDFCTPSETIARYPAVGEVGSIEPVSWADTERDASAWLSNEMQYECFDLLQKLTLPAKKAGKEYIWRLLQNSDHLYYMCTKFSIDEEVHEYFSPYKNPYSAYINYRNVLDDFERRI
ncbi:MAG: glycoside hydrolase family 57 protein, partial [Candidatus Micrarchaeota archaeon]